MSILNRNLAWVVVLFSTIVISSGFMEIRHTQVELAEKNEFLTDQSHSRPRHVNPSGV